MDHFWTTRLRKLVGENVTFLTTVGKVEGNLRDIVNGEVVVTNPRPHGSEMVCYVRTDAIVAIEVIEVIVKK